MSAAEKAGQVERALTILRLLTPHALDGLTNREIIKQTGYSGHNVCRDLAELERLGEVKKEGERWHPTARAVAVYRAYSLGLEDFASRASAFDARVEAQAHQLKQ